MKAKRFRRRIEEETRMRRRRPGTGPGTGVVSIHELGADHSVDDWLDYQVVLPPEEYDEGLLLALLADDSFYDADEPAVWVPLHAWRALAQLQSVGVIEPVLRLAGIDGYQQAYDDFDLIAAEIGEIAVGPLMAILADRTRSQVSRTLAASGLGVVACSATEPTRQHIFEVLRDKTWETTDDPYVNGEAANALHRLYEFLASNHPAAPSDALAERDGCGNSG